MSNQPFPQTEPRFQQHLPVNEIHSAVQTTQSDHGTVNQVPAVSTPEITIAPTGSPAGRSTLSSIGADSQTPLGIDGRQTTNFDRDRSEGTDGPASLGRQSPQFHDQVTETAQDPRPERGAGEGGPQRGTARKGRMAVHVPTVSSSRAVQQVTQRSQRGQRRMLRVREAAEYLGISSWKVRELINRSQIPYVQHGFKGHFSIDIRDLDAYIESRKRLG